MNLKKINLLFARITKSTAVILCSLLSAQIAFSQDPCDVSSRNLFTYSGSTSDDQATIVGRIGEHGYIIGGYQLAGATRYLYLARLNLCGEVIWQNIYNEGEYGIPTGIIYEDGSIYITAYKSASYRTTFIELGLDGTIISSKIFGTNATYSRRFIKIHDDNIVYCGTTNEAGGAGANDIYMVKTTLAGTFLWQKKLGRTANDFGHNVFEDLNDDLVAVGYTRDYMPSIRRGLAIKLDEDGNVIWGKEFHNGSGVTYIGFGTEIAGAYYFSGRSDSGTMGGEDGLIIKTDLDGNIIWSKFIGTTGDDDLQTVAEKDGFLYVSGTAGSDVGGSDIIIARMDYDGNLLEYTSVGTGSDDFTPAAYINFGVEVDGFYGIASGNTGEIGGTDFLFYRLDSIATNCLETGVVLSVIDAGMITTDFPTISNTPTWSFTPTSYAASPTDFENGIICSEIEDPDAVPCAITADFEFVIAGISSEDGTTGGCYINPVQFNDLSLSDSLITSWIWDFGDAGTSTEENPEHTYDAPGTYTITLTVESTPGCFDTYTLTIILTNGLDLDLLFNEPSCFGFSDGSVTVNVVGGLGDLVFTIEDADGNLLNEDNSNTANTLPTGWYYITVTDDSDCGGLDSVFLDQPGELDVDLTIIDPLCYGFETGIAMVDSVYNATGSYGGISYFWEPNPGGVSGIGADSTGSMGAGNYTLTINDENGCSNTFDFSINQPDSIYWAEVGFKPAYCRLFDYQSGNGVVFGSAAGGTPDFDYLWTNLDNGDTDNHSTWGGLNPGNYQIIATDANGCTITETFFLDSLNPIASFDIISDDLNADCQGTADVVVEFVNTSQYFANPFDPAADTTFFWSLDHPNAGWTVSHDFYETFDTVYGAKGYTYQIDVCLIALNKNGCKDTACKLITIYEPFLFESVNVFSPNGDGVNDEFTFEFRSASITDFHCLILNRWGVVVGELNSIADSWGGTDRNGDKCTHGTYFYKYEATTDNATKLVGQGTVQLVR